MIIIWFFFSMCALIYSWHGTERRNAYSQLHQKQIMKKELHDKHEQ